MRNNVIIKKDDYERYKIPISFFNLFPKSKKNYLWEELEKRHPCFSNDFCYSSRNYFSKKGLISDVVVMEKSKLAEYKNKCSFSGKLAFEGDSRLKVFRNNKTRAAYFIMAVIFIILLLIILKNLIFSKMETCNKKEIIESIVEEEFQYKMKNYELFNKNIIGNIFSVAREHKGNINALKWELNCSGENVICAVDNVYPEQFESVFPELEIPVVKYVNRKPAIDFSFVNNFLLDVDQFQKDFISIDAKKEIRTLLENNNMDFIEETTSPYGIVFEGNITRSENDNFLVKLGDLLSFLEIYVVCISVTPLENAFYNQKFNFCINFSDKKAYENNVLNIIGENISLFFNQKAQKFIPLEENEKYVLQEKRLNNISNLLPVEGVKVGEIVYKSGKKVVFYKNNNGKIHKKEIYGEECM